MTAFALEPLLLNLDPSSVQHVRSQLQYDQSLGLEEGLDGILV